MPYQIPTVAELLSPTFKQLVDIPDVDNSGVFAKNKLFVLDRMNQVQDHRYDWHWEPKGFRIEMFNTHFDVFKRMKWYEPYEKSIDVFTQIWYLQVLKKGYWMPGDIVQVTKFIVRQEIEDIRPTFLGFECGSHFYKLDECYPATREHYEKFLKAGKESLPSLINY